MKRVYLSEADQAEAFALYIPAPTLKPVRKRKTGKLSTPVPLLNVNQAYRSHYAVVGPIRKEWRRRGRGYGNASRLRALGLTQVRIDAFIDRPIRGRSDAQNYYPTVKAIVDGLVDAGLIPDDNDKHLSGPFCHPGRVQDYGVLIVVTPFA